MLRRLPRRRVVGLALAGLAGCLGPGGGAPTPTGTDGQPTTEPPENDGMADLRLSSQAFDDGEPIPERYGKSFENVNPPLAVGGVPDDATSLALVVDDPDAPGGTFVHWLVWNVPPGTTTVPEGWDPPAGVRQGTNDFGNRGYDGPRPPSEHTYRFRLSALDVDLDVADGARVGALRTAMEGHVLATATLTGTFAP